MFWIGVSLLVMSLTGLGDDTRSFLRFWERLQATAEAEVAEPQRKATVTSAFNATRDGFEAQRATLKKVGDCVEKLDRRYDATGGEYAACAALGAGAMEAAAGVLIDSRQRFRQATTEAERARIRDQVLGK
jgi:hypothetical protein